MYFHSIFSRLHGGAYTTEELNRELKYHFGEETQFSLTESQARLFWLGRELTARYTYLYLPGGRQEKCPETEEEADISPWRQKEQGKQVFVSYPTLYRCDATGWLWEMEHLNRYVDVSGVGHMVELLRLEEDGGELVRCVVTDEPRRVGTPPRFHSFEAGGQITITGVLDYTERLTIPAQLDGKPVAAAYLSYSPELRHIRSLTVEEGVRKLDFFWGADTLEQISLPEGLELVDQPRYIHYSAWFRSQPEGPVYLQNWYLGTKGEPLRRQLKLREGTVGIIQEADTFHWDSIVLPPSLTFIGSSAFPLSHIPPKVTYAPGTEALRAAFDLFADCFEPVGIPETLPRRGGELLSPRGLYDLGSSCQGLRPAICRRSTPLPPRFRYYQGRWVADVLYCTRLSDPFSYYGMIEVETGKLLELRKRTGFIPPFPRGDVCTNDHKNIFFQMAEDYLTFCAAQIRTGQPPSRETLEQMSRWWYRILPETTRRDLEALLRKDDPGSGRRRPR